MAFYCQNMLEMAVILCEYDAMYEEVAFKFVPTSCGSPPLRLRVERGATPLVR
jgi:hypothetical protein